MPRQSRSSRPAPRPAPAQSRSASTMAAPPAAARPTPTSSAAPPQTGTNTSSGQPGMLAQMAATAGSVAVGSTIGHGLSSMFFGGSSSAAEQPSNQDLAAQNSQAQMNQMTANGRCDIPARDFTKCLEVADYQSCSYYLEQLKACQAAASQY